MKDPARVIGEPLLDLGMLVGGVVVGDGMEILPGRTARSTALRNLMNSLWVWLGMHRPTTVPSRMLIVDALGAMVQAGKLGAHKPIIDRPVSY